MTSFSKPVSLSLPRNESVFFGVSVCWDAKVATGVEVVEVVVKTEDVAGVVMSTDEEEEVGVVVVVAAFILLKAAKEFVESGVHETFGVSDELETGLNAVEETLELLSDESEIDSRFFRDKRARFFTGLSRPFILDQF